MARRVPLAASTPSILSAMAGSLTPTTWNLARAGLARGPRKLNTVGMPSSLRTGPANRMAGWNRGAKQNPSPTSSIDRATPAGPRSATAPSASSTSAAPTAEDEARPPCLQTLAPDAATTSEAMVETLMDRRRSPPVPHVSTRSSPAGRSSGRAWATMARTKPVISATDSPFARSATASPAICAGVASPASTWPRTCSAWPAVNDSPPRSRPSTPGQRPSASKVSAPPEEPGASEEPGAGGDPPPSVAATTQSHHRSWFSTPRPISPSCTWLVPSTMVSCLASRYQSSVGWSSM